MVDAVRVVRRLAPGASAGFALSVPRRDLPISGEPGVYWIGAQALGTGPDGRDILADGRARSFISLVPPRATAEVSLLVPLRQDAERDTRTRLTRPERLARVFERDGRLSRIVDLFDLLVPAYRREGKAYLSIAIGCTGGRHRSVAIAEALKKGLTGIPGVRLRVKHRDIALD